MVFIDAMNLYEGLQDIGVDTKLDYYKFSLKLVGPQRRLIRAHVSTGAYDQVREPEKYAQQMKFFNKVHRMPFVTLKTRPAHRPRRNVSSEGRRHPHRHGHGDYGVSWPL